MKVTDKKGMILVVVMSFMSLLFFAAVSLAFMIRQDVKLIERIRDYEKARSMAEAGVNHAIAKLKLNGFSSKSDFSASLDTGSYSVVYSSANSRTLITSTGTVGAVKAVSSAEVKDNTPTALNYFTGAGNDVKINALISNAAITGDIHANNNVYLKSGPIISWLTITGNVSATGIVKEGTKYNTGSGDLWDNHVVINGDSDDTATVYESQPLITFPTFDYESYKNEAVGSGDYYSGNTTFTSETLTPDNGIVYVDGDANIHGACVLNGGIIADNISIYGTFTQKKAGTRNVIIAKAGDVKIRGRLYAEEALVYASLDISALEALAVIDVNGLLLASRDIDMWNVITYITYTYAPVVPPDISGPNGEDSITLVSWNK